MIARRLLLALLLCAAPLFAHAERFSSRVIVVIDGDTVLVLRHGHPLKIRLADIDAPEVGHAGSQKSQPYGPASRDALKQLVLQRRVEVDTLAIDKYGRTVALLRLGALNVNEEMVRRGMAWEYSHFHSDQHYIALQQQARQAKRGLWQQAGPMPPWQWRRLHEAGRVREQPSAVHSQAGRSGQKHIGQSKEHAVLPLLQPGDYHCGSKRRCSQMRSCNEAHYYLTVCGVKSLNPEGDGEPCKKLCLNGR